jgi:hypothetical protein
MRNLLPVVVLACLLAVSPAVGAPPPAGEAGGTAVDEVKAERASLESERRKIVAAALDLTPDEHQKFWPLYKDYRDAMVAVADKGMKVIFGYAEAYNAGSLQDEKAKSLIGDWMTYEKTRVETRQAFMTKFMGALPARKVFRFFQVENKLDAIITMDVASQVPLAD